MSEEYDTNEYLITNNERIFGGNALEFMTAIYKAEQLPVRIRLYAASKSVEFESDKSGHTREEIREQVRRELMEAYKDDGCTEKFEADVKRLRAIIIEQRDQQLKAWVADGVLSEEAAHRVRGMWAENGDRPFHIEDFAMPDGGRTWESSRGCSAHGAGAGTPDGGPILVKMTALAAAGRLSLQCRAS
jgi:hypothetical protein